MKSIKIGQVELQNPFVQAALSGYSDLAMRLVARRHGASFTLNEVVLDKSVVQKGKGQKKILRTVEPDHHPVGGQLMGSEPDEFARAARMLADAGYDVIDINFGCPVKKVLGRCRGGFLLSKPQLALQIVGSVLHAVGQEKPVTVKLRKGMDDSAESEKNFFTILDGAFELGAAGVTVHGRSVRQRYIGPSDWRFLLRVKKHVGEKLVFGSGDLFNAQACIDMMQHTGVDGVTIARGAIGNPWIFRDCLALASGKPLPPPPSITQQGETITEHFNESVRQHGERLASKLMRKIGIKYSELHPCSRNVRDAFVAIRTVTEFQQVIKEWYDPQKDWPPVVRSEKHGDLIPADAKSLKK